MADKSNKRIKHEIIQALSHPEADEGLYFRNLYNLHEADERPAVEDATPEEILHALEQLITDGHVTQDTSGEEPVFLIAK